MWRRSNLWLVLALVMAVMAGCSGSGTEDGSGSTNPTASNNSASVNKDDYPVFPDTDAGADPAVPAEQGGAGFTGEGWETNTEFDLIGDPRAVKGGLYRFSTPSFPATLRYTGLNGSTVWNFFANSLIYETLLELHPTTMEYAPALASHWQILPDRMTFRFRIDPNARWSDGQPVTSGDVIATWKLETDKGIQDPFHNAIYNKFEEPVAESKYIVRVKAKEAKWVNFSYFASQMMIYPAHLLNGINGETFIRDWNFKMLPGTGPYVINESDVDKGNTITLTRRPDYWAVNSRRMVGRGNFDQIRYAVVRDDNLEFEMLKRGDLDNYYVNRAQWWAEELDFDKVQNGQIQKRKIYHHGPNGLSGIAFNTRREPFNDIRFRKAIRHLFNREQMVEKLMYGQYDMMDSHFPGGPYENLNNEKVRYDPQQALQLLGELGWKDRDANGRLMRNGQPLDLELLYYDRGSERYLTIFQEDLRTLGIGLNLRYATPETAFQLKDDLRFGMLVMFYGAGTFPAPEQMYDSSQADVKGGDNLTGFKDPRLDAIVDAYDREFDLQKRMELIQELDGIVTNEHHWVLFWSAPFYRYAFWNKFGHPNGYVSRIAERSYHDPAVYWWIDPQKAQMLEQSLRDPSIKIEVGPSEDRYWMDFERTEEPTSRNQ